MEDEENQTGGSLIAIALAVFGVVLGGAALYFGLTANQRLTPLNESLAAESSSAARIQQEIAAMETRLTELSAQVSDATGAITRLRAYGNQSEAAINRLASDIRTNREQIVKTAEQLNEFAASGFRVPGSQAPESAQVSAQGDSGNGSSGPSASGTGSSEGSTYTIQSGDTMGRIAASRGVSLQALLDANPDVDPRRMSIGRTINIPAE